MIDEITIYAMLYMALPVLITALLVLVCMVVVGLLMMHTLKAISEIVARKEHVDVNERGRAKY